MFEFVPVIHNLPPVMSFDREWTNQQVAELAAKGVFIGTSSWKYEGWLNQLYTPARYEYRGKVAKKRLEQHCLTEYSEVFKTVCVDAAYYTFPKNEYLQGLVNQVPEDFRFGFKVTDTITIKNYPNQPRHGAFAGKPNPLYLSAEAFTDRFLKPCETIRQKVGVLMFEFSRFYQTDYEHGRDFIADLDRFLASLPKGWPYAVEFRNDKWLVPEYFACLNRHGVTHVFNSWSKMPPVREQMALPGSRTNEALVAARFLLKPGRKYEDSVKLFEPYSETKEVYEDARQAAAKLILDGERYEPRTKTYIYVNNRLEGNALKTIEAILRILRGQ